MRVDQLQVGELYAVYTQRARLDRIWRQNGQHHVELSMGRSFQNKHQFSSGRGNFKDRIFSIEDTWEDFKSKREQRRSDHRVSRGINRSYREALKPLGLEVDVWKDQIVIKGDQQQFAALLGRLTVQDKPSSSLAELL